MQPITLDELRKFIDERFGGRLSAGKNSAHDKACILEAYSECQGQTRTDVPNDLRIWDISQLNDITVSAELRTQWMPRVLIAYQGAMDWPMERQQRVAARIVVLTIQRIIAELSGLPEHVAGQCRAATSLEAASRVSRAAASGASGAGWAACWVAAEAASPAGAAAMAAGWLAAEAACVAGAEGAVATMQKVFVTACELWIEAANCE